MTLSTLPTKQIGRTELPSYFRITNWPDAPYYHTFVQLGEVKRGGNEPYCFTEEKACAGHVVRVLVPEKFVTTGLVVRDDGTVWSIYLPAFKEAHRLKVLREEVLA